MAADDSTESALRAEAVLGLSAVAGSHLTLLLELAQNNEASLREEALRTLREINLTAQQKAKLQSIVDEHPESGSLVNAIIDPQSLTQGRPALDDTAAWAKRLAALQTSADLAAGERIFYHPKVALCANCHRVDGRGNVGGPDLSHIGSRDKADWLIDAILQPDRDIAPQFMPSGLPLTMTDRELRDLIAFLKEKK